MKKIKITICVVFITLITGCRYDNGPLISFRTAFGRLYGDWEVEYFEINGVDHTQEYKDSCNCIFHFGYYSYNRLAYVNNQTRITSIVNLNHDQKNILHISSDGSSILKYEFIGNSFESDWEVKKLTNKKLWMKCIPSTKQVLIDVSCRFNLAACKKDISIARLILTSLSASGNPAVCHRKSF